MATNEMKHLPRRGDPIAIWIEAERDEGGCGPDGYHALDGLLATYHLHADADVPLNDPIPEPQPSVGFADEVD